MDVLWQKLKEQSSSIRSAARVAESAWLRVPAMCRDLSAEVNSKGYPVAQMANPDACTGCASCAIICPDSCITVYRQKFE